MSSTLVPPPHSTLEQARFIRLSTAGWDTWVRVSAWRSERGRKGLDHGSSESLALLISHHGLPVSSWEGADFACGSGSHTRVALCLSCSTSNRSWSSGTSAWYFEPMFIRLQGTISEPCDRTLTGYAYQRGFNPVTNISTNELGDDNYTYGSKLTGVASPIRGGIGGVMSELPVKSQHRNLFITEHLT